MMSSMGILAALTPGGIWNALDAGTGIALSDAGLTAQIASGAGFEGVRGTRPTNDGKWYYEAKVVGPASSVVIGITVSGKPLSSADFSDVTAYRGNGDVHYGGSMTTPTGTSATAGDTVMVAIDANANTAWFGVNGTWLTGDPVAGTGGHTTSGGGLYIFFMASAVGAGATLVPIASYSYTLPTGFNNWT